MTKWVPDTKLIKFERRKALVGSFRNISFIFLGAAAFDLYRQGWPMENFSFVLVGVGLCLFGISRYLKFRWRDILAQKPR